VGAHTLEIVSRVVDDIVTLPDERIFEALLWTLARTKASWRALPPRRWRRSSTG
jgi:threonine dehydratase